MDLMKMMGQLQESQKKVEAAKAKMAQEQITQTSPDGLLSVTVSKSGEVKNLEMNQELLQDVEMLEDYLLTNLNRVLTQARTEYEAELAKAAKEGLPKIPGMPGLG